MEYLIGVDGGGSKTDLILIDPSGAEKAILTVGGTNPGIHGTATATRTLIGGLRQLLEQASVEQAEVALVLLCMSGNQPYWQEVARQMNGWGRVVAKVDSEPVLFLTAPTGPVLVLHGGTGSFVAARDGTGKLHFGGGLGYSLGDPGSGYDLGWRAFRTAFFQIQGWSPAGQLANEVRRFAGHENYQALSQWLYTNSDRNRAIADFAPRLFALAEAGDDEAAAILEESLADLVSTACAVADQTGLSSGNDLPCGLSGPTLTHPLSLKILERLLAQRNRRWQPAPIEHQPIEGVRQLLRNLSAEGDPVGLS